MVPPIDKEDVNAALDIYEEYECFEEVIFLRVDYIIKKCVEIAFGEQNIFWKWVDNSFSRSYDADVISFSCKFFENHEIIYLDKDLRECNLYEDGIPTRWLYENFEEEFAKGIKNCNNKGLIRKQALSKLTKEEKIALGFRDF